jgi:hypothetical protein
VNAVAYVNAGEWIADCPRRDCANAERLEPRQSVFACSHCLQIAAVDWPSDVDELTEALDARPVPSTRNWAPAGHRQAISCGFPEGQSVAQLCDENREHEVA